MTTKTKLNFCPTTLRQILDYDPETGILTWKVREIESEYWTPRGARYFNSTFAGKPAGFEKKVKNREYTRMEMKLPGGKNYLCHRVIWAWMTGEWPENMIDHEDQNPLNNRWNNLREVDNSVNQQNATRRKDCVTGITGVSKTKTGRYQVRINIKGKQISIGTFDTLEEATQKRKEAETENGYSKNHGREKTW